MPPGKNSSKAGSSSSRTALPSSLPSSNRSRSTRASVSATPAQHPPQHRASSSARPLRALAPKPRPSPSTPPPPSTDQSDDDEPTRGEWSLIWPANSPPQRPRLAELPPFAPRSPPSPSPQRRLLDHRVGISSPRDTSWFNHQPTTISPELLCLTPEQRRADAQASEERAALSATPVRPPVARRSGARLGRPPRQQAFSQSARPMRALAPRLASSSSPQYFEPSSAHRSPLERPRLYPSRADLLTPSPPAAPLRSATALPSLRLGHHFWGPNARELVPCDKEGTIRAEYKRERIDEVEAMRRRGDDPPYWTVQHIQEVCADVHRMSREARAGFGDLHKQLRELYDLHAHVAGLYPPAGRHPDDVVSVTSGRGVTTALPRILRDFIDGMSEHLLAKWQPFGRARPEWNVDSKIAFLEDFSCFLRFHNKFYGQRVILMQAPEAPGWQEQRGLQFWPNIPFRGYQERRDNGVTSEERSRDSFVDCFWDT